ETPDLRGIPTQHFFEHGHKDTHGVVAEHRAARDAGDELRLGNGDGQAIVLVDVHHHRQVGTSIAHVDDAVRADAQGRANLFERGDFPPTRGGADDGLNLTGRFVEAESRADDAIGRHDAFQRRLDDLLRRRGDDVERDLVAFGKIFERAREEIDIVLQADALARFYQVFAP